MKKSMMLALLIVSAFALVACGGDDNGGGGVRNITLSYADWGDQELNQRLIDAFMEEYPHIDVVLRRDITGAGGQFTENLLNAQAAGVLPDVFAIDNVPVGLSNGLILDITDFWDNDPDTQYVYPNIQDTAVYNGRRFAVPSFQFINGVFVNITLLERYNIPIPDKDWTIDEFVALAEEVRRVGQNDMVYSIEPWFGDLNFTQIWPTLADADVGYNTWDGEQFNFTSPEWIRAYEVQLDLWSRGIPSSFTEAELAEIGEGWPWLLGYVAMNLDATWMLWMVEEMANNGFEVGFWPYPGGAAGQFPPTVLDYTVVSSQTQHPEEAYMLASWMSFGRQGWDVRMDVLEERLASGEMSVVDRFPVADYPEIWERLDPFLDLVEGLRENVDLLEFSKPDVDKWLAGNNDFWEWTVNQEFPERIAEGLISPAEFASEWETRINQFVQEALDGLFD